MIIDVPDIKGKLELRDQSDVWGLMQDGHYEPEETDLIKKLVKKSDICVDIGANIGYYTVLMSKLGKFVYAFEPEPSNYKLLLDNIILNNLGNVQPLMYAVSDKNDVGELHICYSNHGMHRLYKSKWCEGSIPVKTITLNEEFPLLEPDFVKMDVEGWEYHALLGMSKLIEGSRPTMLIEFHPPSIEESGSDPYSIYKFLQSYDYEIYLAPDTVHTIAYDHLFYRTNDAMGGQNIICIPSKS